MDHQHRPRRFISDDMIRRPVQFTPPAARPPHPPSPSVAPPAPTPQPVAPRPAPSPAPATPAPVYAEPKPERTELPQNHVYQTTPQPQTKRATSRVQTACIVVLVLALAVAGAYVWKLRSERQTLSRKVASAQTDVAMIKANLHSSQYVGELAGVLVGESPSYSTVTDAVTARQSSAFFKDAENGDVLMIYPKAGKAILYRPSLDKLVAVAPYTVGTANPGTSPTQ